MIIIMHVVKFFVKLFFVLMIVCHIFYGQSMTTDLNDYSICGLSKNIIQEAMSYSKNDTVKSIAVNSKCLDERNGYNNNCLTEQYRLIECLNKEYLLALEGTDESTETNSPQEVLDYQEIKKNLLQNIVEGKEELDIVSKEYEDTAMQHLQSIDNLITKKNCVNDVISALSNTKIELIASLKNQLLGNNIDQMRRQGVFHTECIKTNNFANRNIKLNK